MAFCASASAAFPGRPPSHTGTSLLSRNHLYCFFGLFPSGFVAFDLSPRRASAAARRLGIIADRLPTGMPIDVLHRDLLPSLAAMTFSKWSIFQGSLYGN